MGLALKKKFNNTTKNKNYQASKLNNVIGTANVSANNSNYHPRTISLKEIVKDIKIWKWLDRFSIEYNGSVVPINEEVRYCADFYRIDLKGVKGVGFIRIAHQLEKRMDHYNCLAIIYIDPAYRKEGIYDYILSNNCSGVKIDSVMVSSGVYIKYSSFFTSKGFHSTPYGSSHHILVK